MSNPIKQLVAEVISIGDEMTSGARLDTNGQWLSRRLGEMGIHVAFHSTVGDTLSHNVDVFRIAANRADLVIATGGLGPTRDDLTREALAELAQQPLQLRQDALDHILELFTKRNREMPERNQVQAMFPVGSEQIFNPEGSAPGIDIVIDRTNDSQSRIFALPGVPAEMKRMFDDTVAPRILEQGHSGTIIQHLVMKFFGTGESDMEQRLGEMISRNRQPRVGITVSKATISLRITATATSKAECDHQIAQTRQEILDRVSEFYFGEGETYEQQHAIVESLNARGDSLMIIELGMSAPLGDWFAAIDQADCYHGGISLANRDQLLRFITSEKRESDEHHDKTADTPIPDKVFGERLHRFREQHATDWLLVVDSYPSLTQTTPGPLPAQDVHFYVLGPTGALHVDHQSMGGHPDVIQPRVAKAAMRFLRQRISDLNE
jgi:nicotinamide-nucleotide amidase